MFDVINKILDESVRPTLAKHYGDIKLISVKDGVVEVKLLGSCNGCPSATQTVEQVVKTTLKEAMPSIKDVVIKNEISDELWEAARMLLNNKNKK